MKERKREKSVSGMFECIDLVDWRVPQIVEVRELRSVPALRLVLLFVENFRT